MESIFPADPHQRILLDAAWDAYLGGGRVTDAAWELLTNRYSMMVERINPAADDRAEGFRVSHVGGHLINRLWNGRIDLDCHDGLLRRFYGKASPEVATQLMWSIGDGLGGVDAPDAALIARLTALWEFRVAAVRGSADGRELAEFGRWFASELCQALGD